MTSEEKVSADRYTVKYCALPHLGEKTDEKSAPKPVWPLNAYLSQRIT